MINTYFTLFITYALIGWIMEVLTKYIKYKKFINRGFLKGPYCPIYGFGALLITGILGAQENIFIILLVSVLISGLLEYSTSYLMEKIFQKRWWDYSKKKYNINGRICLETLIPFGLMGIILIKYMNPILYYLIENINHYFLFYINGIILILLVYDLIITIKYNINKKIMF